MQFKGKQRLVLVAVVAIVLVGGLAVAGSRVSRSDKPSGSPAVASNINGGTTATPEEIGMLKSYGLVQTEVPTGSQLRVAEELRNYAAGKRELAAAQKGRVDGFYQVWIQTTARLQFQATFDLYNSPASAMSILSEAMQPAASPGIQNLSDPKLGDFSRMYSFTSEQAGAQYEGWAVQWVRGRTLLDLNGLGPPGVLHADDVLNAAQRIDARAQKAPIK